MKHVGYRIGYFCHLLRKTQFAVELIHGPALVESRAETVVGAVLQVLLHDDGLDQHERFEVLSGCNGSICQR